MSRSAAREVKRSRREDLLAVQAVWCEPVSRFDFPILQGKNKEFLRVAPESGLPTQGNVLIFLHLLFEFPTRWNREFLNRNRECVAGNREFAFAISSWRFDPPPLTGSRC